MRGTQTGAYHTNNLPHGPIDRKFDVEIRSVGNLSSLDGRIRQAITAVMGDVNLEPPERSDRGLKLTYSSTKDDLFKAIVSYYIPVALDGVQVVGIMVFARRDEARDEVYGRIFDLVFNSGKVHNLPEECLP